MGFGVWGLGFGVWGLGFGVSVLGVGAGGLGGTHLFPNRCIPPLVTYQPSVPSGNGPSE